MSKAYEVITDRIIKALESGVAPWRKPWTADSIPKNLVSKKPYRGVNVFLLSCADASTSWWLTYNQAKKLGGNVKRGEKGTPVIFWKFVEDKEDKTKRYPLLRYYTVFNIDQCEGINPAKIPAAPEANHDDPITECEKVVAGMPNAPIIRKGGAQACYSPLLDEVRMPVLESFTFSEHYYSVLFHELGHATGHESRLGRLKGQELAAFGSHTYGCEELVAEMTAAFLCGHCGILNKTEELSAAYIDGWKRKIKEDIKMVVTAASAAQKAADCILGVRVRALVYEGENAEIVAA